MSGAVGTFTFFGEEDGAANQCLRGVIAMAALPAMWLGAEPLRVAESLAAAVFAALRPEFVYVALSAGAGQAR